MNLVERAKNIIFQPKTEWNIISQETTSINELLSGYLLVLGLIPAFGQLVRYGFIGYNLPVLGYVAGNVAYGIRYAAIAYITTIFSTYLSAYVIDLLAPNFGGQKSFIKSFQLVVYSYTPMMLAGLFYLIPGLSFLNIVGLYGLYLLYIGMKPIMQIPGDKVPTYFVVCLLVIFAVYIIIEYILAKFLLHGILPVTGIGL